MANNKEDMNDLGDDPIAEVGERNVPKTEANTVKMTVTLPRSVAAFLRWKAEVEGMKRDELLRRIITHYAKKLKEREMHTPPIID